MSEVVIVRTGSANLASVVGGLERLGAGAVLSEDAGVVRDAPLVVLPGVGAFGPAITYLRIRGLDVAIRDRVQFAKPLLAICLGMQMLCQGSEEADGEPGLGAIPGVLSRFRGSDRVPHMGWNQIKPSPSARVLQPASMYFANSYRLEALPEGWEGATTLYNGRFASAIERGSLLACQFHPELSGDAGLSLIARWLERARRREGVPC